MLIKKYYKVHNPTTDRIYKYRQIQTKISQKWFSVSTYVSRFCLTMILIKDFLDFDPFQNVVFSFYAEKFIETQKFYLSEMYPW